MRLFCSEDHAECNEESTCSTTKDNYDHNDEDADMEHHTEEMTARGSKKKKECW